jgi:hypothetical protein
LLVSTIDSFFVQEDHLLLIVSIELIGSLDEVSRLVIDPRFGILQLASHFENVCCRIEFNLESLLLQVVFKTSSDLFLILDT